MIRVVKGNLLDAAEPIIAHQVNCQKKMNSGVAKAIREKYPIVFDIYQETRPMLGFTHFIDISSSTECKYVANMYAQDTYGYDGKQYTNYGAFKRCCDDIIYTCRAIGVYTVAMPYKIGSDRGGADWDKIMDILLEKFTDVDLTLYKL